MVVDGCGMMWMRVGGMTCRKESGVGAGGRRRGGGTSGIRLSVKRSETWAGTGGTRRAGSGGIRTGGGMVGIGSRGGTSRTASESSGMLT